MFGIRTVCISMCCLLRIVWTCTNLYCTRLYPQAYRRLLQHVLTLLMQWRPAALDHSWSTVGETWRNYETCIQMRRIHRGTNIRRVRPFAEGCRLMKWRLKGSCLWQLISDSCKKRLQSPSGLFPLGRWRREFARDANHAAEAHRDHRLALHRTLTPGRMPTLRQLEDISESILQEERCKFMDKLT